MNKTISATDANLRFSELLRTVKKGRSVIVTSHGKPVAKITPLPRTRGLKIKRAQSYSPGAVRHALLM